MSLKVNDGVVYRSKISERCWKIIDGITYTRCRFDPIWRKAGWPEPEMNRADIQFYLDRGDFEEIKE